MDNATALRDTNARSPLWYSNIPDDNRGAPSGVEITDSISTSLNDHNQTRLSFGNTSYSSPDISLASLSLLPSLTWKHRFFLGSQHLSILLNIPLNEQIPFFARETFI